MEHTGHQWPQGVGFVNNSGIEKLTRESNDTGNNQNKAKQMTRPGKDQALSCPRCNSLNTKFCYYNNYSLSQPRHFCKNCRRYWTQGGSLRNVPVGGGSRKNKRPSSSSSIPPPPPSSSASENYRKLFPPITFPNHQSPRLVALGEARDLNLSYPAIPSSAPTIGTGSSNANANAAIKGLSSMMMSPNFVQDLTFPSGGFHSTMPEFKPATISSSSFLDFSLAHNVSDTNTGGFDLGSHGNFQLGLQEGGGEARDLFPVGDPKQAMPSDNRAIDDHQQFEQKKGILGRGGGEVDSSGTGFWNQGLLVGSSTSWINGNQIH